MRLYKEVAVLKCWVGEKCYFFCSILLCFRKGVCLHNWQSGISIPPKTSGKPSSEHFADFEMASWVGLTGELFRAHAATFGPAGNISPWCHVFLSNHQLQIKFQTSLTFRDFER